MRYSGYELLWMFAVYSVAGWCLEVCAAAAKQKKFVNRGYLKSDPFCPVYGLTSAAFGIVLPELKEHLILLPFSGWHDHSSFCRIHLRFSAGADFRPEMVGLFRTQVFCKRVYLSAGLSFLGNLCRALYPAV